MFDLTNAQRSDATVETIIDSQTSLQDGDGFTPREIARLTAMREQIQLRGQRDRNAEDARLRFARRQYERGYITE